MKKINLISKSGKSYTVNMPLPQKGLERSYIFAFAKSGSTLLDNMVSVYCQNQRIPNFSLFNTAFDQGVSTQEITGDAINCVEQDGYVYTGFRHFPIFDIDLSDATTILLTRDPRDMLVSMYYSIIKSHVVPKGNLLLAKNRERVKQIDINTFVVKSANIYLQHLERYKSMLSRSKLKIFRYEDVIYNKKDWLVDVLEHLCLSVNNRLVKEVASRFDIIPQKENDNEI